MAINDNVKGKDRKALMKTIGENAVRKPDGE